MKRTFWPPDVADVGLSEAGIDGHLERSRTILDQRRVWKLAATVCPRSSAGRRRRRTPARDDRELRLTRSLSAAALAWASWAGPSAWSAKAWSYSWRGDVFPSSSAFIRASLALARSEAGILAHVGGARRLGFERLVEFEERLTLLHLVVEIHVELAHGAGNLGTHVDQDQPD